jgi:DNA-binding MarR family transcriptional regulator
LNGTNICQYTQSELAEELSISPSSVSRYLKQAEDCGYIKRDDKGIHLKDRKIFIITSESTFAFVKNEVLKGNVPYERESLIRRIQELAPEEKI